MQRALEYLDTIAGTIVSVVTEVFGTLQSMAITRYPTTRDAIRRLGFEIEFKQVVLAEAGLVSIPPEAPAAGAAATGLPDEQDVGEQPTTSTTAADGSGATQEAADQSLLLELTEALGVAP